MINSSRTKRFDVGSPNVFLATALSFKREATRISRKLRVKLNQSGNRIANS